MGRYGQHQHLWQQIISLLAPLLPSSSRELPKSTLEQIFTKIFHLIWGGEKVNRNIEKIILLLLKVSGESKTVLFKSP